MLASKPMVASDLLLGYLAAFGGELDAVEALAERPLAELAADPRLRTEAALRLGRVLDALTDVVGLTLGGRLGGRRPAGRGGAALVADALSEGAGPAGAAVDAVLPLLCLARHRKLGNLDLARLPADRLHRALASAGRARRWIS